MGGSAACAINGTRAAAQLIKLMNGPSCVDGDNFACSIEFRLRSCVRLRRQPNLQKPHSRPDRRSVLAHITIWEARAFPQGCGEQPGVTKGEKGDPGPRSPAGPDGPPGPVGPSGTFIRFVDGECRQACTLFCRENYLRARCRTSMLRSCGVLLSELFGRFRVKVGAGSALDQIDLQSLVAEPKA